jgi:hypothetical protein
MEKHISPDGVCEKYAEDQIIKLTCRTTNNKMILIEGSREALEFLGNLLIAQANFEKDCNFSIEPEGAGNTFFTEKSNVGLFIHRLPCGDGEIKEFENE